MSKHQDAKNISLGANAATDPSGVDSGLAGPGLNFNLSPEQQEIVDLAEKFSRDVIVPAAPEYDASGEFPWPVVKKAHEIGLMNLHVPAEYGGELIRFF